MQLTPRYDGSSVVRFDGPRPDLATPLLRQRRRLVDVVHGLHDEQWASATRCEGWTVRDVVSHLVTTDQFWALSIGAGRAGEPTRFLTGFDPVATPAQLVDGSREQSPSEVLSRFAAGVEAFAAAVDDLDDAAWGASAEAPPGHVTIDALVRHALWDSWIHERDIVLPLGLPAPEEADELAACLEYVAALGPVFRATSGSEREGVLVVAGTDPDVEVVVVAGTTVVVRRGGAPDGSARLEGRTVDLIEGLSFRAPLLAEVAPGDRWLLGGLDEVFDLAPQG